MTCLTQRQLLGAKAAHENNRPTHLIDYFAIALTHGLIAFAAFRLLSRDDLDDDGVGENTAAPERPWLKNQVQQNETRQNQTRQNQTRQNQAGDKNA